MKSLSRSFLVSVGVMSLIVTILGALGAFVVFRNELSRRQIAYLGDYVRERSGNIDKRFSNLTALHQAAIDELEQRVARLTEPEARRLADQYFPLQADGSRRSRAQYYDGVMQDGRLTHGMIAFITKPQAMTGEETRLLAAAFDVVSNAGQAAHRSYDNFYFFTPATKLIMFEPNAPDQMMFYRQNAPATLDVSKHEISTITLPANDPQRVTRCTKLQRRVKDKTGERLATGCVTPVYLQGRYVGAFGSSIELTGFFQNAVKSPLAGADSLIVTDRGELIAYPGFTLPGKPSEATVARYERSLGLRHIIDQLAKDGRRHGVATSPDGGQIIAFSRLTGTNWYLLLTYPKAAITASAARSASWVLVIGGAAALLQTLLVVALARRTIVRPLGRLAASCKPHGRWRGKRADVGDVEGRADEIGVLARSLRQERDKVQAVLASLEDRVRERTAALQQANEEKSRFLANMSHEIRTPLNGVIAVSETLAKGQTTPANQELAGLIVSSGRLLERVLSDILDFSKIEAGEVQLAQDDFDLARLVAGMAELHRAAAQAKGLAFEWTIAGEAAGRYRGDPVRLSQILSNLLSNAVKFTAQGAVRLVVGVEAGGLRFTVHDTGIGFDQATKARLFRRFEQADDSIGRRFGGTGLGLAISRSLAELMGGVIEVESQPGTGSSFSLIAPLQRLADDAPPLHEPALPAFAFDGLRVLVAEDHPTNQRVIQVLLESVGIRPVIVASGARALAALEQEAFDLVLMDMQMPDMDGLTATRALRAREAQEGRARTPVLMLTANAMDEHIQASAKAGADLHLAKPIRAAALFECMARLLSDAAAPPQSRDAETSPA